jgi:hypothetical protein
MGGTATIGIVLGDSTGQPISDASVSVALSVGMVGMEGEHDEMQDVALAKQGPGVYQARITPGRADMALTGMTLTVKRGDQTWTFAIAKDDLSAQ